MQSKVRTAPCMLHFVVARNRKVCFAAHFFGGSTVNLADQRRCLPGQALPTDLMIDLGLAQRYPGLHDRCHANPFPDRTRRSARGRTVVAAAVRRTTEAC